MIWWPFNEEGATVDKSKLVVTHQWSGDHSIVPIELLVEGPKVVTHQWSGDHSILT